MNHKITKENTIKFEPIWKICKERGIAKQNLYRWIREGKIKPEFVKKSKVEVERILVNPDGIPNA